MDPGAGALLSRVARRVLYLGLFASSFLVFRVGPFTVGDLILLVSLVLVCLEPGTRSVRPLARWAPLVALLVVVGGLFAAYRAQDVAADIVTIGRLLLLVTVLPWQARTLLTSPQRLTRAISWWVAGAAISVGGALLQARTGSVLIEGAMVTNAGRYSGFTQNVSDAGGIACVATVIAISAMSRLRGRGIRFWMLVAVALGLAGLVLSGSVSGMIATAVGVIYLILRGNIRPGRAILLSVVSIAGLAVVLDLQSQNQAALNPIERLRQTIGLVGESDSLNTTASRLDTMQYGMHSFLSNPLVGVGLDPQSAVAVDGLAVHNLLIASLYQGGLLVFLALIIPIISAWRRLWVPKPVPPFAMQANVAFLSALVFAMTAPSFFNRYFWVPVALSYVAGVLRRDVTSTVPDAVAVVGAGLPTRRSIR